MLECYRIRANFQEMIQRLPPILLGIVVGAYWGRVMRMAYKARRRTGRSANLLPTERVGRITRIFWVPAVIAWIVQPFCTAFWNDPPRPLRHLFYIPWIAWPALGVAIACLVLSRICWKAMGRHWRMGIDPSEENPLIASGPFRYVRHPIYALSILMMLASMAMLPSPVMLGVGVVHICLLCWESRREELHLLKIHGESYKRYWNTVGGFFPKSLNAPPHRSSH
jgi:protein-S-isoprenylcysteine O-methyltransferase Ste14